MTDIGQLKAAITALLGLAATEEQALLSAVPSEEEGSPQRWAALPLVAHNTEFRRQQVLRLQAIRRGEQPPEFAEVDHESADLYRELVAQPAATVRHDSWQVAGELIDELRTTSTEDLLDPARNPWLKGRQLWLQIVVRGFWHPTGHLGDYYLARGAVENAVSIAAHAAATADRVAAPGPARGMARYNLACAQARAGELAEASSALADAVALNPDLRVNAERDRDLSALRDSGLLAGVLAS
jgi:tetratricopeptide (TPR) repeat protein